MQYLGAFLGFFTGFAFGLLAIKHVTKGQAIQKVIENKQTKIWLGLFGWFFALVGAYVGYTLMLSR